MIAALFCWYWGHQIYYTLDRNMHYIGCRRCHKGWRLQ